MRGWSPGSHCGGPGGHDACGPAATNCYVYNATFYMLGESPLCAGDINNSLLDTSIIHSNATASRHPISSCSVATADVTLAPPAADAEVTAKAKKVLGDYPKPYDR